MIDALLPECRQLVASELTRLGDAYAYARTCRAAYNDTKRARRLPVQRVPPSWLPILLERPREDRARQLIIAAQCLGIHCGVLVLDRVSPRLSFHFSQRVTYGLFWRW